MSDAARARQPTKRPSTFDEHIPGSISGHLRDHRELVDGQVVKENFTCAGVARIRVRFLATVGGQLVLHFLRSVVNHDIDYPTNQPDPVTVAANVEAIIDVEEHFGEGRASVSFAPNADGEITYCDVLMT